MNIAFEQVEDVLSTFKSDSTDKENGYATRAAELSDAFNLKIRNFKYGFILTTVEGRRRKRALGIYENSFSSKRNRFHERGRISLTSKKRK